MKESDFTSKRSGRLIKNLQGVTTFAPHPLPPTFEIDNELMVQVGSVHNLIGRLDGTAKALPDRKILIRSFVRREAQLSSYIENTYASYEEVATADIELDDEIPQPVRETLNAERAIEAGVHAVFDQGQPVTLRLIRQMHQLLLARVRGHRNRGSFRQVQVFIGSGPDMHSARFVPPPVHLLNELMDDFAGYLDGPQELPAVIRLALIHYQFETIHPFEDGNGRLGRILILLGLCQYQMLTVPLFNASLYFERNRQEYYDRLLRVSTHGEWIAWIRFFVEGLRVASVESLQKVDELHKLRHKYAERLQAPRNSVQLIKLLDQLFIRPVITVADAQKIMGVTYPSALNGIEKLIDAKILAERKPKTKPARFIARGILKAVNAEPTRR